MRVLVTGASRGIGRSAAIEFSKRGHEVLICARSEDALKQVAKEAKAQALVCDLSQESQINELYNHCGPLDVVINNAAMIKPKPFIKMTSADWDETLNLNLRSIFLSCKAAFDNMKGRGGSILNMSSLGGLQNTQKFLGFSSYSVSKAAVIALTECLAVEGRPLGIRVNALAPGAVDTQMLKEAGADLSTQTTPESVAQTLVHLALDETLSGTVLPIWSNQ